MGTYAAHSAGSAVAAVSGYRSPASATCRSDWVSATASFSSATFAALAVTSFQPDMPQEIVLPPIPADRQLYGSHL